MVRLNMTTSALRCAGPSAHPASPLLWHDPVLSPILTSRCVLAKHTSNGRCCNSILITFHCPCRHIDKVGGLDNYVLNVPREKQQSDLADELRQKIEAALQRPLRNALRTNTEASHLSQEQCPACRDALPEHFCPMMQPLQTANRKNCSWHVLMLAKCAHLVLLCLCGKPLLLSLFMQASAALWEYSLYSHNMACSSRQQTLGCSTGPSQSPTQPAL